MPQQLEFFEIPSPCIGVCQSDEKGLCRGCMRNRQERFDWMTFSDEQKRDVLRLCRQRFLRLRRQGKESENEPHPDQPSLFDDLS